MPSQVLKIEPVPERPAVRDVVSGVAYRRVRRIAIALALVLAIPSLLLVALLIGLNPLIRRQVETFGTAATGVPVALEEARVNVIGGIHLTRLSIGSPREFREVRAFRLARFDAAVLLPSLLSRTIEIQEVLVVSPEITIEIDPKKKQTNWGVLMDQLVAKSRRSADRDQNFIIQRLRITKAVVVLRAPSIPKGISIRLRDIELQGIGSGPGSAAPFSLVLATIVQALITGAIEEWSGVPGEVGGLVGTETRRTSAALGDQLKKPSD